MCIKTEKKCHPPNDRKFLKYFGKVYASSYNNKRVHTTVKVYAVTFFGEKPKIELQRN